jgi:hypothetical protein
MNILVSFLNMKNLPQPVSITTSLTLLNIDRNQDSKSHLKMGNQIRKRQRHPSSLLRRLPSTQEQRNPLPQSRARQTDPVSELLLSAAAEECQRICSAQAIKARSEERVKQQWNHQGQFQVHQATGRHEPRQGEHQLDRPDHRHLQASRAGEGRQPHQ